MEEMSLEAITAIAQVVAAAGVIAGLAFVGVQIRHNTRAVRAATFHGITDSFNAVNLLVGKDTQTARVMRLGFAGLSNLNDDERLQFGFVGLSAIRVMETLFYESHIGMAEAGLWDTEQRTLRVLMSYPGIREWWAGNELSFTPEFRKVVENILLSQPGGEDAETLNH